MSEKTTNTSNDESRKEVKQEFISDEEIKKIIKVWADGKLICIAATDPEFLDKDIDENVSSSGSSDGRRKSKRIKTTAAVIKRMSDLLTFPNVTLGAKKQTEKVKQIRKKMAERKSMQNRKQKEVNGPDEKI